MLPEAVQEAIALNVDSLSAFWPEVILAAAILVVVAVDLLLSSRKRGPLTVIALVGLVFCMAATAQLYEAPSRALFAGMVALDPFGLFLSPGDTVDIEVGPDYVRVVVLREFDGLVLADVDMVSGDVLVVQ